MESKRRSQLLLSMILIVSVFIAGCSSGEFSETSAESASSSESGGDFVVGSTGAPTTFNSLYSFDTASSDIIGFVFDGLLKTNENLEYVGNLAKDWEVSEDGLTWTFHLNKGVKFHDGVELTAEDVVFTYNIPLSEGYTGPRGAAFEKIEKVEAADEYTVKVTLQEPYAPFLATNTYAILPKHILGDVPVSELAEHPFNTESPVGTGPFKFVEWKQGQYVKVEANEEYFQGRPNFDTITYKTVPDSNSLLAQLQAGDIHYMAFQSEDLATAQKLNEQGKIRLESGPSLAYNYLGWNQLNPLFQDKEVRQALTHAINREEIIEGVLDGDGELANSHALPSSWSYTDDVPVFGYDPEASKQLLAEAGWEDTDGDGILDKDGEPFEFTLSTTQGNKAREKIAVVVQQQLKEVGIKATPKTLEHSAFVNANMDWDFEANVNGWNLGADPDPSNIFSSKHIEEGDAHGLNYTHHSNPELDELLDENIRALDQEERKEVLHKAYKLIAEDQPYTFLYYPNLHYALPVNLEGYTFHSSNPYYNIKDWELGE